MINNTVWDPLFLPDNFQNLFFIPGVLKFHVPQYMVFSKKKPGIKFT